MIKPILVVLAAGMGSRYGGHKQIDPVGPSGELIIDFSVYDAIEAGFDKVIFVIKQQKLDEFKEIIGNNIAPFIDVKYAFQDINDLPQGLKKPDNREKPWGTAHAVYSAREHIDAPFAVINADDYYGKDAYKKIYDHLTQDNLLENQYAMVGFKLKNTVTDNGYVSRGICTVDKNHNLTHVIERTRIKKVDGHIGCLDENSEWLKLEDNSIVSMNIWGFTPSFIKDIEENIVKFLPSMLEKDPHSCEFYLPTIVDRAIIEKNATVKVLKTSEKWYGVTYKDDKTKVVEAIKRLIEKKKYPRVLWERENG